MSEEKNTWPGWNTVRLIGRGSFGAVYEIERKMFDEVEKAALKVITIPQNDSDINEMYNDGYDSESITDTFKSHLKSIVSEYSLMRKMNGSSNIVNCDDVRYIQHADGIGWDIYIKMELLTPLSDSLAKGVSDETVVNVGKDLCEALVLCSKYGIIHRDIKPQNIFMSPNGDYKLGDFGIAKTVEKTQGGTKIGTYKYMAPEVYNNQPYGAAADIYSLGLVLYWMLNERRMPFLLLPPAKLKAGDEEQARLRRFNGEKIPAPLHGSSELKRIVLKACAFDLKDRYQTAEEMLSDFEALEKKEAPVLDAEPEAAALEEKQTEEQEEGTVSVFNAALDKKAEEKKPEKPAAAVVREPQKAEPVVEMKPEPVTEQDSKKAEELQAADISEDEGTVSVFNTKVQKKAENNEPVKAEIKKPEKAEEEKPVPVIIPEIKKAEEVRKNGGFDSDQTKDVLDEYGFPEEKTEEKGKRSRIGGIVFLCLIILVLTVVLFFSLRSFGKDKGPDIGNLGNVGVEHEKLNLTIEEVEKYKNRVSFGEDRIIASRDDGTVFFVGSDLESYGHNVYEKVSKWENIKTVAVGNGGAYGISYDGVVYNTWDESSVYEDYEISAFSGVKNAYYNPILAAVTTDGNVVFGEEEFTIEGKAKEIATFWYTCYVLDTNGSVCFIEYESKEVSTTLQYDSTTTVNLTEYTDIASIAYSPSYGLVCLKNNGTLVFVNPEYKNIEPSEWTDIVAVSAYESTIVGLKSDGTVKAFGDNGSCQCNVSDWSDIVYVYTGVYGAPCTVGLKSDGSLVTTLTELKKEIESWKNIVKIHGSYAYTGITVGAIDDSGRLYINNNINDGAFSGFVDIDSLGGGTSFYPISYDGRIINLYNHDSFPYEFGLIKGAIKGDKSGIILLNNGRLNVSEYNKKYKEHMIPTEVLPGTSMEVAKDWTDIKDICIMYDEVYALREDGKVLTHNAVQVQWSGIQSIFGTGGDLFGITNQNRIISTTANGEWENWDNIVLGDYSWYWDSFVLAGVSKDGKVFATGTNIYGECDVGDWDNIRSVVSIASVCTLGLKEDGTVVVAGLNGFPDADLW